MLQCAEWYREGLVYFKEPARRGTLYDDGVFGVIESNPVVYRDEEACHVLDAALRFLCLSLARAEQLTPGVGGIVNLKFCPSQNKGS